MGSTCTENLIFLEAYSILKNDSSLQQIQFAQMRSEFKVHVLNVGSYQHSFIIYITVALCYPRISYICINIYNTNLYSRQKIEHPDKSCNLQKSLFLYLGFLKNLKILIKIYNPKKECKSQKFMFFRKEFVPKFLNILLQDKFFYNKSPIKAFFSVCLLFKNSYRNQFFVRLRVFYLSILSIELYLQGGVFFWLFRLILVYRIMYYDKQLMNNKYTLLNYKFSRICLLPLVIYY
eukprot:TRINITY_DN15396_c0_g1_i1.p1 TRINITY_DN15396_c0_g1~~TRINITY_DN15396_c0_g1_i1.p1  ORF type:complete len:234 (+),score=-30.25 TRINITY_DN15396_c0_g1_i1:274-975(+)